ncbi:unnamed protein product [Adineta steineri]|uniref:Uncharacterized protein n=1 Tax=Adineta steineri TaxID=433720 RepID=A0A819IP31_9BILA|nr:unnamed protein product [Adineta steineri]CAF3917614.1 unnamed protein product [Adineta steineri]
MLDSCSLSRQHIDEESNKKKNIHAELTLISTNPSSPLATLSTIPSERGITTLMSAPEKTTTTAIPSEPSQSCK